MFLRDGFFIGMRENAFCTDGALEGFMGKMPKFAFYMDNEVFKSNVPKLNTTFSFGSLAIGALDTAQHTF